MNNDDIAYRVFSPKPGTLLRMPSENKAAKIIGVGIAYRGFQKNWESLSNRVRKNILHTCQDGSERYHKRSRFGSRDGLPVEIKPDTACATTFRISMSSLAIQSL